MRWDNDTVTIKGERLALTERGKVFFRTLSFMKDALTILATLGLVWFTIAVMAVFE